MAPRRRTGRPRIGVVGLGHVGLATACAFATHGLAVTGYDVDADTRTRLSRGQSPWFEPGLATLLRAQVKAHRLAVTDSASALVRATDLVFLCVPTPSAATGAIDLSFVRGAAEAVGDSLRGAGHWVSVVLKSTTLPGTVDRVLVPALEGRSGLRAGTDFGAASNPEFLAEGTLIADALHPSRIVVGTRDSRTARLLREAYAGFGAPVLTLSPAGAELVKYAANAMLATRVSFANEFARLAEQSGTDVVPVLEAIGRDPRIGPLYLRAGPGFGGSCFTKDLRALVEYARELSVDLKIPAATLAVNDAQAARVVVLAEQELGSLSGKTVAVLGLSFKADSDDVADSRAYPIVAELVRRGARAVLYDPRATDRFVRGLPAAAPSVNASDVETAPTLIDALTRSDAAIVQTDWPEFRRLAAKEWGRLRQRLVVDARRSVDPAKLLRQNVRYRAIGRAAVP